MKEIKLVINNENKSNVVLPDSDIGREIGFTSDKFRGYLWVDGDSVTISVITSINPGEGNFRNLLLELKERFNKIIIPCPSIKMRRILTCLGDFRFEELNEEFDEEVIECMVFNKINYEE